MRRKEKIEFILRDGFGNKLFQGMAKRHGYCYMGERETWGWCKNIEKEEIIVFSKFISEELGNRRYVAKVPPEIIEKAKMLTLIDGYP